MSSSQFYFKFYNNFRNPLLLTDKLISLIMELICFELTDHKSVVLLQGLFIAYEEVLRLLLLDHFIMACLFDVGVTGLLLYLVVLYYSVVEWLGFPVVEVHTNLTTLALFMAFITDFTVTAWMNICKLEYPNWTAY
jgi:hypothetical protein